MLRLRRTERTERLAGIAWRSGQWLLPWACALCISMILAYAMDTTVVRAWSADPGSGAAATAAVDACTLHADLMLYATHDQWVPDDNGNVCGGASVDCKTIVETIFVGPPLYAGQHTWVTQTRRRCADRLP